MDTGVAISESGLAIRPEADVVASNDVARRGSTQADSAPTIAGDHVTVGWRRPADRVERGAVLDEHAQSGVGRPSGAVGARPDEVPGDDVATRARAVEDDTVVEWLRPARGVVRRDDVAADNVVR